MNNDLLIAGAIGFVAARVWNFAKRLWLYRNNALPPQYFYRGGTKGRIEAIPRYFGNYLLCCFQWYDPYLS